MLILFDMWEMKVDSLDHSWLDEGNSSFLV